MMFTVETKLSEVINTPGFEEFRDFLIPDMGAANPAVRRMRIKNFSKMWLVNTIVDGLNYLLKLKEEGTKIFYPVYDAADAEAKPELKEQVLFHFPVEKKTKCILICAGGGYTGVCSFVEAFPVAQRLNELGYHAFVVHYRAGKYAHEPNPVEDLANAVRFICRHEKELNVDMQNYAVMGFSAGGHLAACYGTRHLGYEHYQLPKPGALILAYPVITMGSKTHAASRKNLLGKENSKNPGKIKEYSVELNITESYPPCFIWQCARDNAVPVENSGMLTEALQAHGVPYVYHTFDSDVHGWGLATGTLADGWVEEAAAFWSGKVINNEELL